MNAAVLALCVGQIREIAPGKTSAIDKRPVEGPVTVATLGLGGDVQGDKAHHGGPHMAIHHYPVDHYSKWREELPAIERLARPGAFGENIHAEGLTEETVCIGDRFRLGSALLEVSMGRQPCATQEAFFGQKDMVRRIIANGRCGWYYRVIEEGTAEAGDTLAFVGRAQEDWSVARAFAALFSTAHPATREELAELLALPALSPVWGKKVAAKLG